ncbi:hypothetical protein [Streptomyces sp. NPDC046978]|uniref:hypothetical protein n=1 Tax=unclassified Streptomyces TaxID=2593676 RepID=UPI003400C6A3
MDIDPVSSSSPAICSMQSRECRTFTGYCGRPSDSTSNGRSAVTALRLASGAPLEPIAGNFTGGAYFLCAEEDACPAVVLANSEGAGGLIADDLAGALEIIIGLKWQACLGFSGGGDLEVMQASAQHLERHPDRANPEIAEERARVTAALDR